MTRYKVNIKLLPVKAHYFFFCAASAAIVPFLPVIGKQMGILEIENASISAVAAVCGILAKPTVGIIADRLRKRKMLFLFFILLALMASLCIGFLPSHESKRLVHFQCGNMGSNYIVHCSGKENYCASGSDLESIWREKVGKEDSLEAKEFNNLTLDQLEIMVQNYTNTSSLELCRIRCEINHYLEGKEFCSGLLVHNRPDMCPIQLEKSNSTEVETQTIYPRQLAPPFQPSKNDLLATTEVSERKPYELEFDANIKIAHIMEEGDCLFMPIETIGFGREPKDFQKFSCLPDEVVLKACFADCPNNSALNTHMERILTDAMAFQSTIFWLFGMLSVLVLVALTVVNSLSDALCFQLLGDDSHLYGRQRLLAAIGWGATTLLTGYLIDRSSEGSVIKDYTPAFYILAGLFILDLTMSYKWEWRDDKFMHIENIKEADKPKSLMKDVFLLVSDLRIIIFFFVCILVGMCTGIHWYFLFWYVEDVAAEFCDTLPWLKLLQGLMVAVQCMSEIPFFYYAGWFIKKLGTVHCLSLVLFVFGLRLVIYSFIPHPWGFIPVEALHGITFGLFYSVMATYASEISPPGSQATVQGIVGAGFEGIGIAAGSIVAGALFRNWGGRLTFRIFGIGAFIFCGLHVIIMYFLKTKRVYGIPINDAEPEGQEMYKINGVNHDVDAETESD